MSNTQILTRKFQIFPVGDKEEINRVYQYIRDCQYVQNKAYNIFISNVYSAIISGKSKEEINLIYKKGARKPKENNPDYSLYNYNDFKVPVGLPIIGGLPQTVKNDLKTAQKAGLFKGNSALPNKRRTASLNVQPVYVRLRDINLRNPKITSKTGIYHTYSSYNDFLDNLYSKRELDIYLAFANNITFKFVLGNPYKSYQDRNILQHIFEEDYLVKGSSISFDKTDKKIMLNLNMEIPKKEIELKEDVVVGVDVGLAIPAVCGLNINSYAREYIGSKDDFLRVRTQISNERKRVQKNLKMIKGGHGRKKKMKSLDRFTLKEKNFVQTYNHMVSKRVVDFAVKNHAKYINLENLKGYDANIFILRNWSYYQLQQYIKYKAEKYGIETRMIDPYHTSQVCSCCGHWEEGQRINQSTFICKNPECKNFGVKINADFNASRNIALSTNFISADSAE